MGVIPSSHKTAQLHWEVANIQTYLNRFEFSQNRENRVAQLGRTGQFIFVRNFPLPDGYRPDYIDIMLITDEFPSRPPIGLYILNRNNKGLIGQLQEKFNAFQDRAYAEAQAIHGYTWICYHYAANRWRYCAVAPRQGDNVLKFLSSFFAKLNE